MKAKSGAKRKTAKKSSTRDLSPLDRGSRRVKGGARTLGARRGKRI
jgi:hypothetical protein